MRDRGARFLLPMQKISRHSDEIPTTHTPCSPTHHPSRNKQVRPTSTARARSPQDTEYSSSISRFFSLLIPTGIPGANLGIGECAAAAHMRWWVVLHTLALPHLRHSSVSRCPSPKHRVWACLTMPCFEGQRPSNLLLHTQGPRTRACSEFEDSLLRARA